MFKNFGRHALFSVAISLVSFAASALDLRGPEIPYYGHDFYERVSKGEKNEELIKDLRAVSKKGQNPVGYNEARKFLLGSLYLENNNGSYGIKEVYCDRTFTQSDFAKAPYPAPNVIPDNNTMNTEHTWPQSRFSEKDDKGTQKCDLHHLYPTHSKMNGIRGNYKFGEVTSPAMSLPCSASKFGTTADNNGMHFEPPMDHKGNVARSLFYFSVRYNISIDADEEVVLRKWNEKDPVDAAERDRNEKVFAKQGNRNPFIDYPELASEIANF